MILFLYGLSGHFFLQRFFTFQAGHIRVIGVGANRMGRYDRDICFSLETIRHERAFYCRSGKRLLSGFGAFNRDNVRFLFSDLT